MRLLRCLADSDQPMMLRDLSIEARMPAAKAHRYLVSLARMQLVEQHPGTGRYDLGAFALDLGLSALGRLQPVAVAVPYLEALKAEVEQTVALAVWANRGPTIVSWIGSDAPVSASLRVGSVMPLTRSATGLAFLAFLPDRLTNAFLLQELVENSRLDMNPKSATAVRRLTAQIRVEGLARTSSFIPGIGGLAVPVFDHAGSMALAVIALGYTGGIDLTDQGRVVTRARAMARALSQRLGHCADPAGPALR